MIRQEYGRIDPKRRQHVDHRKKQFVSPLYGEQEYKQRLNFYTIPPTSDITLEEFELWAIDRLKGTPHHIHSNAEVLKHTHRPQCPSR